MADFARDDRKIAILTAYDAPSAEILEKSGIDVILVGDSLGMVVLGYDSTIAVTMDEMIHHAKAVRRGAKNTPIIGDLPLKGIEKGPKQALDSAKRFIREAGCDAVKVEWGKNALAITDLLTKNKIPVMGHVGLTPQTAAQSGGFKVRGKDAKAAEVILNQAMAFEKKGAFSVVLECMSASLAKKITEKLKIPTIGIGAGPDCDGQVLVFHDVMGIFKKFKPRFVKHYADLSMLMEKAVEQYVSNVKQKKFPTKEHSY